MNQSTFVSKSRSILSDNAGQRRLPNQRSGKWLDESRLSMVKAGETRVFQRPLSRQFHHYDIAVVMDNSGSMWHHGRLESAVWSTHALAYALDLAGANVEVMVFNRETFNVEKKTWSQPDLLNDLCHKNMYIEKGSGCLAGGNHDHMAIRTARTKLLRSSAPGKIMLVLSDGQPHCDYASRSATTRPQRTCGSEGCGNGAFLKQQLHHEIAVTRKMGVLTLGIGIQTDAPVQFYGEHQTRVVHDLDNLYSSMAQLLQKNIRRG